MTNIAANLWRRLGDRVARKRAEFDRWRAEVTRKRAEKKTRPTPQAEAIRILQEWLDCSRLDVQREQAEVVRERAEVVRQRAENDRQREEIGRLRTEVEREREESDQLRLDNRALLNSLLGTAGIPPLPSLNAEVSHTGAEAPLRRPSWPQIAAKREIAAARKAESARKQQHTDSKP